MTISEERVGEVIAEVSQRMADPNYAQLAIGHFIESQPHVSRYLSARLNTLGSESVMHAVFHAEVLSECFLREKGRALSTVEFADLDAAHDGEGALERFGEVEPALASYLATNVEEEPIRECLGLVGLAMAASG